jgi:hypothetical protein
VLELTRMPQWRSGTAKYPDQLCHGGVVTRTRHKPAVVWPGCTRTAVSYFCFSNLGPNSVFEFWSYQDMISMQIVQFQPLFHLPLSDVWLNQYSLNYGEIKSYVERTLRVVDGDSTNIGPMANLGARGEWEAKSTQSTYLSYHDTIRTQIFNWRQNCGFDMPGYWW